MIKTFIDYITEGVKKNPFTQKEYKEFLQKELSSNKKFARYGLKVVYRNQTYAEQRGYAALAYDSKGFNKYDASELSRILTIVANEAQLSDRDQQILFERLPKYWKQVYTTINKDILHREMNDGRQLKLKI